MADSLGNQVARYLDGRIQVPPFQRGSKVWSTKKRKAWAKWVETNADRNLGHVVPLILYTLNGNDTLHYIADGRQRLESSAWMVEIAPESKKEEVWELLNRFQIQVSDAMNYGTHADALADFQRSNIGTPLTPAEYYKGLLTTSPPHGPRVYEWIPKLVDDAVDPYTVPATASKLVNKLKRDSFALFLQWAKRHKQRTLWKVASNKVDLSNTEPLEKILADYANAMDRAKLDDRMATFGHSLTRTTRRLGRIAIGLAPDAKLTQVLMRSLLHTWVICRNRRASGFWNYAQTYLQHQKASAETGGKFTGALIESVNGEQPRVIALGMAEIPKARAASVALGVPLDI